MATLEATGPPLTPLTPTIATNGVLTNGEANGDTERADVAMASAEEDADARERERGSEAVERRIEKVMAEMLDQGVVNANDEKAVEAKRVRLLHLLTCASE